MKESEGEKNASDKEEEKGDGEAKLELPSIANTLGDVIVGDTSKDENAEVWSRSAADDSNKDEEKKEPEAEEKKESDADKKTEEKKDSDDLGLSDPFDEKEGSEHKKPTSSSSSSVSEDKGKKEAEREAQEDVKEDKPEGATAAAEDANKGTPEEPEQTVEKDVAASEENKKDEGTGSDTGRQDAASSSSSSESGQEARQDSGYADSFGFDVLEAASGEDEHSTDEETVRIHEEKDAGSPSGVKARAA